MPRWLQWGIVTGGIGGKEKKWGKLWRNCNCRDREEKAMKKCWAQLSEGKRGSEWQRKGSQTHCAGSHTEDLSDSRTKMDSIFISALNLVAPPESASYQFFPHTLVCEPFPFSCSLLPKEKRRIFSQWVSFWDMGLVHLGFSQDIELLLFRLTLKLKCFPWAEMEDWARASCFMLSWRVWW